MITDTSSLYFNALVPANVSSALFQFHQTIMADILSIRNSENAKVAYRGRKTQ